MLRDKASRICEVINSTTAYNYGDTTDSTQQKMQEHSNKKTTEYYSRIEIRVSLLSVVEPDYERLAKANVEFPKLYFNAHKHPCTGSARFVPSLAIVVFLDFGNVALLRARKLGRGTHKIELTIKIKGLLM